MYVCMYAGMIYCMYVCINGLVYEWVFSEYVCMLLCECILCMYVYMCDAG